MNNITTNCCHRLGSHTQAPSPFDRMIAFGYHDGPEEGMVRCGPCGREFRFTMLDSHEDSTDETETRIFALSPIPNGSMACFDAAMSAYQKPRLPNWVPLWSFPSVEDRENINSLVDRIFHQAKSVELVIASSPWLTEVIRAAQSISKLDILEGQDWFSTLGLVKPVIGE